MEACGGLKARLGKPGKGLRAPKVQTRDFRAFRGLKTPKIARLNFLGLGRRGWKLAEA